MEKKIKVTILILSILLGLSLLALAGTLIRARLTDSDPGAVTVPDNLITPEEDTETERAAGYCSVQVGDETSYHYTEPILVGDDASAFTFTVNAAEGTKIYLTPKWGSYSGTPNLSSDGVIGNTTGNTQQENPVAAATTAEPTEPTTTTTAPSRSPEESAASTPDTPADSATAQPEGVTGGEQAPAPEDSNR